MALVNGVSSAPGKVLSTGTRVSTPAERQWIHFTSGSEDSGEVQNSSEDSGEKVVWTLIVGVLDVFVLL